MNDPNYHTIRQHNYLFVYNLVPSLLFRTGIAQLTAGGHPHCFDYFERHYKHLGRIFPEPQAVKDCNLKWEMYQLQPGVHCLIVRFPPATRYLEVEFLAIVFQPKVRYFPVGLSSQEGQSPSFTVREVDRSGQNFRRGILFQRDDEALLGEVCRILEIEPDLRIVSTEEVVEAAKSIEVFDGKPEMLEPTEIYILAATYLLLHIKGEDTRRIPPAVAMDAYREGGQPIWELVERVLTEAQQEAFAEEAAN